MGDVVALPVSDPDSKKTPFSAEEIDALEAWFTLEINDAMAARAPLESVWMKALTDYEAKTPANFTNNVLEDFDPIEVPIGAMHADDIHAHMVDTLFSVDPLITATPIVKDDHNPDTPSEEVKNAKALQRFINWGAANEWEIREAADHAIKDNVILGTGVYYIPGIKDTIKRRRGAEIIRNTGARVYAIPTDDFILPPGSSSNIQRTTWCAYRQMVNENRLRENAKRYNWDLDSATKTGALPPVTQKRETLAGTNEGQIRSGDLYELLHVYASYDIDGDDTPESIYFVWDRNTQRVLYADYSPYDRRPFERMRFNLRAHMPYGQGVLEMLRPFEQEATLAHNHRLINSILANTIISVGAPGSLGGSSTISIYSGKHIETPQPKDFRFEPVSRAYTPDSASESLSMVYAQRRVGSSDLFPPQSGGGGASPGSRTPVGTLSGLLAQTNKRLTPAFDSVRLSTSASVRQCVYRYQEWMQTAPTDATSKLVRLFGKEDGERIANTLAAPDFDEHYAIELTALSATSNRAAARQEIFQVFQTMTTQYYERVFAMISQIVQLETASINPETGQGAPAVELRALATQIITKIGEFMDRFMRNYRELQDPTDFILSFGEEKENPLQAAEANIQAASEDLEARISGQFLPPEINVQQPAPEPGPTDGQ